jgi:polysaccharide export outer membrane protein
MCIIALGICAVPVRLCAQGARVDSTLTLSPGDMLRITVWRQPELSGEFLIAEDGTITHPLYRELKVTGLTVHTVEERVRTFLSRFESNPAFVMTPLLRVIVSGEVRAPQVYTVPPGTSVAQVIGLAGGITDRGRLDLVRVLRGPEAFVLDLTRPVEGPRTIVRSGDQIVVGRRRNILQDVVGPSSAVIGAAAAVASIIIQLRRQ